MNFNEYSCHGMPSYNPAWVRKIKPPKYPAGRGTVEATPITLDEVAFRHKEYCMCNPKLMIRFGDFCDTFKKMGYRII